MNKIITAFFLLFNFATAWSQNFAYIRVSELYLRDAGNGCGFTINGEKVLLSDTSTHRVKINLYGFDSVIVDCRDKTQKVALTKFRPLQLYYLKPSDCDGYELYPEKNAKLGVARFEKLQTADVLKGMLDNDSDSITMKRGTAFLVPSQTETCVFDLKSIKLAAWGNDLPVAEVRYHFLHGEKLIVKVLPGNKAIDVKIEGYLKKDQTILNYQRK